MTDTSGATAETMGGHTFERHQCGHHSRRRWSAFEIASVVGGFIVFWPLGLLALGMKMFKGEVWKGASEMKTPWQDFKGQQEGFGFKSWQNARQSTGNAAFDDYRKAQLDRLEAERRKLEDEQRAFADYLGKLRKAKDQDEFDRFMSERNTVDKTDK